MSDLDRYEAAAEALHQNVVRMAAHWPSGYNFLRRSTAARLAEENDRREWIADVKRRLGLVVIGEEVIPYRPEWPVDVPDGDWQVVSDHTITVPLDWPPECRCVLLDGEQVSLGSSCPVHAAA